MHREKVVVCDSTVIIALSSLGLEDVLQKLYGKIIIAQEVYQELIAGAGKPGDNITEKDWISTKTVSNPKLKEYLAFNLDKGEAETIALAEEINADLILVDDYWARKFAERRGLKISGTLGVLMRAKRGGIIKVVKPLIDQLIENGFWIYGELYNNVLIEAEEL